MKKVAILQSNYIPWKGYFDMIASVDEFIIFDTAQYTKQDWRNRNLLKTAQGPKWLTIPVQKYTLGTCILDIKVNDGMWTQSHLNSIFESYGKAPFFNQYKDWLKDLYDRASKETHLTQINLLFIKEICKLLDINTKISYSWEMPLHDDKNIKLINLCDHTNSDIYISGPAAKDYLDEALFNSHGIQVEWMDYSNYPEYPQLHPPFEHGVTIFDLILNTGLDATKYMKYANKLKN